MSNKISDVIGMLGRRFTVKILLVFALGFIVTNQQVILKAQEPGQGLNQGPATPALPTSPAAPSPASPYDEYLINPGDVLDVYVYDVPELSHTYTVGPSGVITMPLLSTPLRAAGLMPDQFARAIEEAFRQSGRLSRPEIAVSITQSRNNSVSVDGAVRSPQVFPLVWQEKLIDVLTRCGGLADDAGTTVTITRGPIALRDLAAVGGLAAPTLTVELKKVMDGSDPASTIAVWPGDRVTVNWAGVFYILGQVRSPGGYTLKNGRDELTVLRALAISGDVTSVAKKSKAMIIRKDPKAANGREEIALNLKDILAGRSPDVKLQANDILFIPGSGGKKALQTLTTVPAQVVGGAATAAVIVH
jgi:polysaccharide export outer membrane protein